MSSTVELTQETFTQHLKSGIVLVDWWAPWCGPCRAFAPIYERVAAKYPNVVFGKINTEQEPGLGTQFNITAIPTLMVIKDGVLLYIEAGMLPEKALTNLVEQALTVDVTELKKKSAKTPAAATA